MNSSLGQKRQCVKCAAKFYDLNASPVVCPKCKAKQPEQTAPKRKAAAAPVKKVARKPRKEDVSGLDGLGDVVELEELDDFEDVEHLGEVEEHQEADTVDSNSDDADDEMFIDEIAETDTKLVDMPEDELEDEDTDDTSDKD